MSKDHPESPSRARQNLADLFFEFCQSADEFIEYDNGYRSWKYTYAQVAHAARYFAKQLGEHKVRKGDKVIFWSENRPEWVAAFWGCILSGVIVVPIDYRTSPRFLRHVQEIVDARLILIGEEVELSAWDRQPPVWRLADLEWPAESCTVPPVQIERNDIAEIVFTSGATGEPKGVLITHGNLLANMVSPERIISMYRKWFRPLFPLRFLSLIPLSHMFGQAVTMFVVPLIPGVVVFMRGYSPHEIVRQIRTRRVSVVVAVPKILEVLQKHVLHQFPETANPLPAASHWIFRWWRYRGVHSLFGWKFWAFIAGAASLPTELEEFWSRLGLAVIQGYGLTETAPIVAFNNPFDLKKGTVGKPVAGLEIEIAPDGEILVRGENVTPGYYQAPAETASAFKDGWFHTGDLGSLDESGNLTIRGRKKEMIVTPEGLKVFPEDVENVLNQIPGVRESAVVGRDRVHAVLVLQEGSNSSEIVRRANLQLEDHQKIRSVSMWPGNRLPRTEGTQKLRHGEIQAWVESGGPAPAAPSGVGLADILRKYAPDRTITSNTTLGELGLSSLDRVELMMDLERQFDMAIDESVLTGACTVSALAEISTPPSPTEFPTWNRRWLARVIRHAALSGVWLPLTRMFAHARISGREHLASLRGPVIFAPNHQSHLDTPLILSALPARFRHNVAVAMWKEYFDAHFFPERHTRFERFVDSLTYWLVTLFFNAFPVPQTETGARQSLRYIGDLVSDNWTILFFPEGERTEAGEIHRFQPGIGLLAGRLGLPVVPIRLRGVEKVLHRHQWWPRSGRVEVAFGTPLYLQGEDYAALAKQVEEAVLAL
ncbi:MAG: AMP-binding protein [Acidobacteriia bacterium]|nr:AMP-binding protein [Terriglobia bacterium]